MQKIHFVAEMNCYYIYNNNFYRFIFIYRYDLERRLDKISLKRKSEKKTKIFNN